MAMALPARPEAGKTTGRVARTKGVSMLPEEFEDASTVEELTGVGFSEVYRRFFAPQMKAAAEILRETQEAGVTLDRASLRDVWHLRMTREELAAIYTAESTLVLGD